MIARLLAALFARLHGAILHFYPPRFRTRFGAPMSAAVEDALAAAARRGGAAAVLADGARSMGDACRGVGPARAAAARDHLLWPEPVPGPGRKAAMFTDAMIADGRSALRALRRAPLFTVLTVAALALGLGATTAIFTVVRGVLLRPLPYRDAQRLVMLWSDNTREGRPQNPISPANFLDYQRSVRSFERMEALYSFLVPQRVAGPDGIDMAQAAFVTPGMFDLLGRAPLLGRTFTAGETRGVVVLSHGYWQRRFGGDRSIVGRHLPLPDQVASNSGDAREAVVIGVMPDDFAFPYRSMLGPSGFSRASDVDVWLPLAFEGPRFVGAGGYTRNVHFLSAVGRLAPGVSLETARAELAATAAQLAQAFPESNSGWSATAVPLLDQTVGTVRPALILLLAGVLFLLAMTCVNVANLLLARRAARRRDTAVRTALGAGRRRLLQQTLVESLVLALAGGLTALLVARWGVAALLSLAPIDLPRLHGVSIDAGVVAFTFAAACLAGLVIGLVSSVAVLGTDASAALRGAGRGVAGPHGRTRAALVVAEVALAVVLTAGAGLLVRSFVALVNVDPGFRADSLLTLQMNIPDTLTTSAKRVAYYQTLFERLDALPDVRAVGGTTRLPLGSTNVSTSIDVEGRNVPEHERPEAEMRRALHDYFRAMGIPVLEGRTFTREDGPDAPRVAVVNRTLARRLFGRESPVGRRVRMGPGPSNAWLTIVGVVGDIRHQGLEVEPAPEIYIQYLQGPPVAPFLVVRTTGDPARISDAVRAAILDVDRSTPVFDVKTMEQVRWASVSQRRFVLTLAALFGVLALVLAALGVYGVMALIVAERTQEMGVRLALGARPVEILALVLKHSLGLASAGIAVGVALALLAMPAIGTQLYGVRALDPATFLGVPSLLAIVAALAALRPARAAMRVDPAAALRD